jgi:dihydroxyacetone kinase
MFDTLLENGAYSRTLRQWDTVKGAWQEVKQSKTALQNGDRVIALVNNLGATPLSELYGVYISPSAAKRPASSSNATSSAATVPRWIWRASPSLC